MENTLTKRIEEHEDDGSTLHVKVQIKLNVPRFIRNYILRKYSNKSNKYISITGFEA